MGCLIKTALLDDSKRIWYFIASYHIFLKTRICLLFSVSVLPACMHVCDVRAWCVWRSEKGMDGLEMELQVTLSQRVGTGN